ncbi:MAG: hypothetical protein QXK74_07310 [Candidatus Nitrosocaldaceae archaeon]
MDVISENWSERGVLIGGKLESDPMLVSEFGFKDYIPSQQVDSLTEWEMLV